MKVWEHRLVTGGLVLAGVLFLVGAARPTINGQPLNVVFLLVGLVCLVLGVVGWRQSGNHSVPPTA